MIWEASQRSWQRFALVCAISETGLGFGFGNTPIATSIVANNLGGRSIAKISANEVTSLLLADDGTVFGFGSNGSGRLGLGTNTGQYYEATPLVTTNLGNLPVTDIAAGGQHGLLLAPGFVTISADFDFDGDVDGHDFLLIQRTNPALIPAWQAQYPSPVAAVSAKSLLRADASVGVPEPTSVVLFVLGTHFASLRRKGL